MSKYYCKSDHMYHSKSEFPKTLQPFLDYQFSSGGYTGNDFKTFSTKFKNAIKKLLPNGYEIHTWHNNHYDLSAVLKNNNGEFAYVNISDVRFFPNEWALNILIRTMKHDKDWNGGSNHYTDLINFTNDIQRLWR